MNCDRPPLTCYCDGSGCPGHHQPGMASPVMCSMCGEFVATQHVEGYGLVTVAHQRPDIIAMIERGDFDATD